MVDRVGGGRLTPRALARAQPSTFRLQQLPRPRDVLFFRTNVAHRQMQDLLIGQLGMRWKHLSGRDQLLPATVIGHRIKNGSHSFAIRQAKT